jgi:hypothetical protein
MRERSIFGRSEGHNILGIADNVNDNGNGQIAHLAMVKSMIILVR